MRKEGEPTPKPTVSLELEIPPMPPAWASPQELHNWEDYVAWVIDVGRWNEPRKEVDRHE